MGELAEVFDDSGASSEASTTTEESTQVESKAEVTETSETTETEAKTEASVNTKAEENDSETAAETDIKDESAEKGALVKQAKDERKKRQERDARIAELEAKLAEREKEPEKRPDVFEDQEAFADSIEAKQEQKLRQATLNIERKMMMRLHSDYESVEASVLEEMGNNPALKSYLQQSENVAEAVYEYGKQRAEFNEVLGFKKDETLAKLKAEIKAELEKEYKAKSGQQDDDLSPSLAGARGSKNADDKGIQTLDDVFG